MASLPHLKNSNSGRASQKPAFQGVAQVPHFDSLQTWQKAEKTLHCLISTACRGKVTLFRDSVDVTKFLAFLRILLVPKGKSICSTGSTASDDEWLPHFRIFVDIFGSKVPLAREYFMPVGGIPRLALP